MAKADEQQGVFVQKPKADVYLGLLVITFIASGVAVWLLLLEYWELFPQN